MQQPIGIFDSGFGGVSVLMQLLKIIPDQQYIYIADSGYCPYGDKSFSQLQTRVTKIVDFLISNNVKIIVVACNTATAAAISYLRKTYSIPFIGMEPAIKPAAILTKNRSVGVLATQGTFNGELFNETKAKYAQDINVHIQIGTGLVEIVENNKVDSKEAYQLLLKYITPMMEADVDYLVLGCTHYPFLNDVISTIAPDMKIINPALPVAKQTQRILEHNSLINVSDKYSLSFFTTGDISKFSKFISKHIKTEYSIDKIEF